MVKCQDQELRVNEVITSGYRRGRQGSYHLTQEACLTGTEVSFKKQRQTCVKVMTWTLTVLKLTVNNQYHKWIQQLSNNTTVQGSKRNIQFIIELLLTLFLFCIFLLINCCYIGPVLTLCFYEFLHPYLIKKLEIF